MHPSFKQRLSSKWSKAALAALIGAASGWMLYGTAVRLYFEYVFYPQAKAQDGYSHPELRYAVFDVVTVLWCLDGLVASVLLLRSLALREEIGGWPRRTILLFVVGFGLLLLGVLFGTWLRGHGV
jgi:hypothetical protein